MSGAGLIMTGGDILGCYYYPIYRRVEADPSAIESLKAQNDLLVAKALEIRERIEALEGKCAK